MMPILPVLSPTEMSACAVHPEIVEPMHAPATLPYMPSALSSVMLAVTLPFTIVMSCTLDI